MLYDTGLDLAHHYGNTFGIRRHEAFVIRRQAFLQANSFHDFDTLCYIMRTCRNRSEFASTTPRIDREGTAYDPASAEANGPHPARKTGHVRTKPPGARATSPELVIGYVAAVVSACRSTRP